MKVLLKLFLILMLVLMTVQPAYALGLQDPEGFETGLQALGLAFALTFSSFLTYLIVNGLKLEIPELKGKVTMFCSIAVALGVNFLTGLITTNIAPTFWPLLGAGFYVLATVIGAWGIKYFEKKLRPPDVTKLDVIRSLR